MKVLQVSTHINIGGIGSYILSLSGALKQKGVEVITASSGGDLAGELEDHGIPHRYIDIKTKFEFHPRVFRAAFALSRIIKEEGVDIVHAHSRVSQVASFIARSLSGAPYVTTCHGYFKTRLRKIFDTWGDRVIAISDAVKSHLEYDLGVSPSRIRLVYNGVDAARFSKTYGASEISQIKKSLGLGPGPVIGNIGRLSPVKGQKFLVRAMAEVAAERPDAQLILVGDGPDEPALRELSRSLGMDRSLYMLRSDTDTPKLLSVMDVFVFPSVKEGLGLALLEAMAAGRACVASGVGGIGNIIENGSSGILVNPEEPIALSKAILRLLADSSLRDGMGRRGRDLVRGKFTLDAMADNTARVYKELLSARE